MVRGSSGDEHKTSNCLKALLILSTAISGIGVKTKANFGVWGWRPHWGWELIEEAVGRPKIMCGDKCGIGIEHA